MFGSVTPFWRVETSENVTVTSGGNFALSGPIDYLYFLISNISNTLHHFFRIQLSNASALGHTIALNFCTKSPSSVLTTGYDTQILCYGGDPTAGQNGKGTMVLNADKIGINRTTPSYTLDVNGTINCGELRSTSMTSTGGDIQVGIGNKFITDNIQAATEGASGNISFFKRGANFNTSKANINCYDIDCNHITGGNYNCKNDSLNIVTKQAYEPDMGNTNNRSAIPSIVSFLSYDSDYYNQEYYSTLRCENIDYCSYIRNTSQTNVFEIRAGEPNITGNVGEVRIMNFRGTEKGKLSAGAISGSSLSTTGRISTSTRVECGNLQVGPDDAILGSINATGVIMGKSLSIETNQITTAGISNLGVISGSSLKVGDNSSVVGLTSTGALTLSSTGSISLGTTTTGTIGLSSSGALTLGTSGSLQAGLRFYVGPASVEYVDGVNIPNGNKLHFYSGSTSTGFVSTIYNNVTSGNLEITPPPGKEVKIGNTGGKVNLNVTNGVTSSIAFGFPNQFNPTALSSPPVNQGFGLGTGDGATYTNCNMAIYAWHGIGFCHTVSHLPYYGSATIAMDCRAGSITCRGSLSGTSITGTSITGTSVNAGSGTISTTGTISTSGTVSCGTLSGGTINAPNSGTISTNGIVRAGYFERTNTTVVLSTSSIGYNYGVTDLVSYSKASGGNMSSSTWTFPTAGVYIVTGYFKLEVTGGGDGFIGEIELGLADVVTFPVSGLRQPVKQNFYAAYTGPGNNTWQKFNVQYQNIVYITVDDLLTSFYMVGIVTGASWFSKEMSYRYLKII